MSNKNFQLIDGIFAKKDALFILSNFFNEKIAYHNRELLAMKEKNDINTGPIEDKLASLHETRAQVAEYLQAFPDESTKFQLFGSINISTILEP